MTSPESNKVYNVQNCTVYTGNIFVYMLNPYVNCLRRVVTSCIESSLLYTTVITIGLHFGNNRKKPQVVKHFEQMYFSSNYSN